VLWCKNAKEKTLVYPTTNLNPV